MSAPLIFLAFANDRDRHLSLLKEESRRIYAALADLHQQETIKVHREESAQIGDLFQGFTRSSDQVVIFHYAGHAGGQHLDFEEGSAHARGLASLLAELPALQLVFLNGCSTYGQVQGLLEAGVKAVIATSVAIEDRRAMEFAQQFYEGLAQHHNVEKAFSLAEASLSTKYGDQIDIQLRDRWEEDMMDASDSPPWGLYVHPDHREEVLAYHLPDQKEAQQHSQAKQVVSHANITAGGNVQIGDTHVYTESGSNKRMRWLWLLLPLLAVGGFYLWKASQPLQLTIFVTDTKGNVVLEHSGRLNIPLGNRSLNEVIGANGRTNFPDITAVNKGDTILIGLEAEGWKIADGMNRFRFTGEPIHLRVARDERLGLIKGVVKSLDGGTYLIGARIQINADTAVFTDSMGFFRILLPEQMRVTENTATYRLSVSKKGFLPTSIKFSPSQSDTEIQLKPSPTP